MDRRRALMMAQGEDLPILNPAVSIMENYYQDRSAVLANNYFIAKEHAGVTDYIYIGTSGTIKYYNPQSSLANASGNLGHILQFNTQGESQTEYWNCKLNATEASFTAASTKKYARINVDLRNLAGSYCYNQTTGQVYYAGKDTPYYGKTNIND